MNFSEYPGRRKRQLAENGTMRGKRNFPNNLKNPIDRTNISSESEKKNNAVVGVRLSLRKFNYCIPGLVENRALLRKRMNGQGTLHEIFVVLKSYAIICRVKCMYILTRLALIFHVQPPTRQNTIKIWEASPASLLAGTVG